MTLNIHAQHSSWHLGSRWTARPAGGVGASAHHPGRLQAPCWAEQSQGLTQYVTLGNTRRARFSRALRPFSCRIRAETDGFQEFLRRKPLLAEKVSNTKGDIYLLSFSFSKY